VVVPRELGHLCIGRDIECVLVSEGSASGLILSTINVQSSMPWSGGICFESILQPMVYVPLSRPNIGDLVVPSPSKHTGLVLMVGSPERRLEFDLGLGFGGGTGIVQ
jgi:hypothetical protein